VDEPVARPTRASLADAAVAMAEAVLARLDGDSGVDGDAGEDDGPHEQPPGTRRRPVAERRQILVHLRADALERGALRAELHDGTPLDGDTLMRLACDAGLVVAKTDERGDVLDIGRRRRTVNPAIKRALLIRDRHCQWPSCTHDAFVEAHHLDPWVQGGETRLDRMILLCNRHHQMAHEGGCAVEKGTDGQLRFFDPDGRRIEAVRAPAPLEGDPVEQLTGAPIDRRTSLPDWDGRRLELSTVVGSLVRRHERAGLPL